ncbi:hypothetical protein FNF31_01145 [Cafeteria roenbergensis]|uniref:UTP23 sensor motif region domain-containing protein n=1 Tax=Cafeteria roenbergensis TaxID=33653 RepID=A0A5A8DSE5_CAFRO|nr:hypothetical protein FNF31_01145 [Cafeteria roenbergensis]
MRVDRAKNSRRSLRFFKVSYGLVPPFHIVVDGPFLFQACKCSVDARKALEKVLETSNVTLYIPNAALQELRALGPLAKEALALAETCHVIEHISPPRAHGVDDAAGEGEGTGAAAASGASGGAAVDSKVEAGREAADSESGGDSDGNEDQDDADASDGDDSSDDSSDDSGDDSGDATRTSGQLLAIGRRCRPRAGVSVTVASMPATHSRPAVGRGRRIREDDLPPVVLIATQDVKLRNKLRKLPGLPILFLNRNVVVMDTPSEASKLAAKRAQASEGTLSKSDRAAMRALLGADADAAGPAKPGKKKRRGPKGPNPLSCLPKKPRARAEKRPRPDAAPAAKPKSTRRGGRGKKRPKAEAPAAEPAAAE